MPTQLRFLAGVLATLLVAGCASDPMPGIQANYAAGRYELALDELSKLAKSGGDRHLYELELGVVAQAAGRPEVAVEAMRRARDRLDDLHGRGFFESLSAALSDDRALDYDGADYEHVLVRALLALADLMQGGGDASAYAFQVLERQQDIISSFESAEGGNPKKFYKLVAFGSYLRAIMNEERTRDREVAEREFAKVKELEPGFAFADRDLERVRKGVFAKKGHGVLQVVALVGRGPFRVQTYQPATPELLAWAQLIWGLHRDRPVLPNLSPVPVPVLAYHADNPTEMHVSVDGEDVGPTAVVTSVEEVAQAEFAAMQKHIAGRALLRRMLKIAIAEGAKEAIFKGRRGRDKGDADRFLASIGVDLLALLWTAAEKADLRCWSLLPASFQVLRVELPEGEHDIVLRASVDARVTGSVQRIRVRIDAGYNTYVMAMAPTMAGGPTPLTSVAARAQEKQNNPIEEPRK